MNSPFFLDLAALDALPRTSLHNSRNWTKAQVYLVQLPDGPPAAVKDARSCPLWFRVLVARPFFNREERALRLLSDLSAVPNLLFRPNADVLVMEKREGTPTLFLEKGEMSREAIEKLDDLVREIHARGLTHGDLHPSNVLVSGENVTLLDWATSLYFQKPHCRGFRGILQRELGALDSRQVAKLKVRHASDLLRDEERELLAGGGSRLSRAVRWLRYGKNRLFGKEDVPPSARRDKFKRKLSRP